MRKQKPDWLKKPSLLLLADLLENGGGVWRVVGGAVRNHILDIPVQDIDIACDLSSDAVLDILREAGITALEVGKNFGVVTAVIADKIGQGPPEKYEIASLRCDFNSDGRHPNVVATDSFQVDAARRDFTINALYMDRNGEITDYYQGLEDLKHRILRFVGVSDFRIQEDYLRILRLFRFAANLPDFTIAPEALHAAEKHVVGIQKLSRERITEELKKWLTASHNQQMITTLRQAEGVWHMLNLPLQQRVDCLQRLLGIEEIYGKKITRKNQQDGGIISEQEAIFLLRLAVLTSMPDQLVTILCFSKAQLRWLVALTDKDFMIDTQGVNLSLHRVGAELTLARLFYWASQENYGQQNDLPVHDASIVMPWLEQIQNYVPKLFPLKAQTLMRFESAPNIIQGELLGKLLYDTETWWAMNGCIADPSECFHYAIHHVLVNYRTGISDKK